METLNHGTESVAIDSERACYFREVATIGIYWQPQFLTLLLEFATFGVVLLIVVTKWTNISNQEKNCDFLLILRERIRNSSSQTTLTFQCFSFPEYFTNVKLIINHAGNQRLYKPTGEFGMPL